MQSSQLEEQNLLKKKILDPIGKKQKKDSKDDKEKKLEDDVDNKKL